MTHFNQDSSRECQGVRALLSEYTDNSLSARQVWEVEKHLAGCGSCAAEARDLRATVDLLRTVPRCDTGDGFMASLHARLDTLNPSEAPVRPVWERIWGWLSGGDAMNDGRRPILSLGLAAVALAILFAANRPQNAGPASPPPAQASDGVHISIATSANSPFSDPAADNLEFRSSAQAARPAVSF